MVNSLCLGDVLLNTLLGTIEADLASTGTDITVVGIGHLARAIDNAAHNAYLQAYQMTGGCLDAGDGVLEVVERATATGTRDVLGLGELDAGSLQDGISQLYEFFN